MFARTRDLERRTENSEALTNALADRVREMQKQIVELRAMILDVRDSVNAELRTLRQRIDDVTQEWSRTSHDVMELDRRIAVLEARVEAIDKEDGLADKLFDAICKVDKSAAELKNKTKVRELAVSPHPMVTSVAEAQQLRLPKKEASGTMHRNFERSTTRRCTVIERVKNDSDFAALFESAVQQGVSVDAIALYESTGGYRAHVRRFEEAVTRGSGKTGHANKPWSVCMKNWSAGKRKSKGYYTRTLSVSSMEERERIITHELPLYHALCKEHYGRKGGKA